MVFEVFRRRQKQLIVVLAVFAMFAFVLADFMSRWIYQDASYGDPVVATAWGRDIKASEVQELQRERAIANDFIGRALTWVQSRQQMNPWDTSFESAINGIVLLGKAKRMGLTVTNDDVREFINAITENKLSGADFRKILQGAPPPDTETANPSTRMMQPLGVADHDLFRILSREMMINRAVSALTPPVLITTPLQTWQRKEPALTHIQLQVVPQSVDRFLDKIEEPTEAQIKETFDKYKNQIGDPEAGVPGFLTPPKVEVQYLVANVEKLLANETVTDAEIKTYYDEHKSEFPVDDVEIPLPPNRNLPGPPGSTPEAPRPKDEKAKDADAKKPADKKAEEKPADTKKADEKPAAEKKADAKPAADKKADAPAKPLSGPVEPIKAAPQSKPEPKAPAKKEVEAPKADAPKAPEAKPEAPKAEKASEPKQSSAKPAEKDAKSGASDKPQGGAFLPGIRATLATTLGTATFFQDDKAEKAKAEPKTDAKVDAPAKPVPEEKAKDAKKADEKPAEPAAKEKATPPASKPAEKKEEPKVAEKTDAPAAKKDASKDEPAKAEEKSGEAGKSTAKDATPDAPKVKPLDQVKDEIATILKRQKASKKVVEQLETLLRTTMNGYLDQYMEALSKYRRENATKDGTVDLTGFQAPPPPDLQAIASKQGFELKSTGPVSETEADEVPGLGEAVRVGASDPTVRNRSFVELAFEPGLYRGRVLKSPDDKTYYLYWKTSERPAQVPELSKIKDEVVRVWKREQAKPKAKEQAEVLAEAVRKAEGDMAKAIPQDSGLAIITTGIFPRATAQFRPDRFFGEEQLVSSRIPEIPNAGEEFLNAVFKLKKGEVAVVPNEAQTTYYIVRVKERDEADFKRFVDDYNLEMMLARSPELLGQSGKLQQLYYQTILSVRQEAGLRETESMRPDQADDDMPPAPTEE